VNNILRRTVAGGVIAALAGHAGAFAQQDETAAGETDVITVVGYRGSLASSLRTKRNAGQVMDAITAEDIGQFPDQNIAEAIQRITGVQITRNNGEGESVSIRGLSAQFTRVEIDGRSSAVTIDSSDPERGSVLSVFASDLYSEIEVIKSPTAADVEGGVGGIVRLKTPSPLDIGELAWGGDIGITDAEARDDTEPSFNGFYSNVFADGRFGLLVAGTYENRDRAIDKIQDNDNWWTIDSRANGKTDSDVTAFADAFFPGRIRHEQRTGTADKFNINAKLQFQVTPEFELFANTFYTSEERERFSSRIQFGFRRGRPAALTDIDATATSAIIVDDASNTVVTGAFTGVRVEPLSFARFTDIETLGLTGGFHWNSQSWSVNGEVSFQSSEEDFIETRVSSREKRDLGFSIADDPQYPNIIAPDGTFDLSGFGIRDLDRQRRVISIEETSARLDAERLVDLGVISSFEFGVRYASTTFDRKQGQLNSPEEGGGLTFADGVPFVTDGTFADGFGSNGLLRTWPAIDPVELYNRFPAEGDFFDNANADENLWNLTEDTLAIYGLANYEASNFFGLFARGNAGVRVVQTSYDGVGSIDLAGDGIDDFGNIGDRSLDREYTDVLPAFNIVLSRDEDSPLLVRAAVTRAVSRPNIVAINPGLVVRIDDPVNDGDPTTQEGTFEEGNPDLDPFRAWQYDLGVEWYFGETGESAISAALFYKDVENFITTEDQARTYQNLDLGIGVGGPLDILSEDYPINGGQAEVLGFEIGFQTPFTFLPGFLSDFGMYANYTYTDSESTQVFTNADTGEVTSVTQPFPGASENSFNLVGYYERGGFSGRLAYNYRDEYLITGFQTDFDDDGVNESNQEFGDEQGRLDLALRYRFENGMRVSFDALNLTEEQNFKFYDTPRRLEDLEAEGRIYSIRVGYVY